MLHIEPTMIVWRSRIQNRGLEWRSHIKPSLLRYSHPALASSSSTLCLLFFITVVKMIADGVSPAKGPLHIANLSTSTSLQSKMSCRIAFFGLCDIEY
jgi:hypothetical protein